MLWVGSLLLLVGNRAASAKGPAGSTDAAAAVAAFQALYQPITAITSPAERVKRGCAEVSKLLAAAKAIPVKLPAGIAVDAATWRESVETMPYSVKRAADACTAPGQTHKVMDSPRTALQEIDEINNPLSEVLDDLKPRALTPEMKAFEAVLRRAFVDKSRKTSCVDLPLMVKLAPTLETPPPGVVDTKAWTDAQAEIPPKLHEIVDGAGCHKQGDSEGIYDSDMPIIHDDFYKLVLLLPAQ